MLTSKYKKTKTKLITSRFYLGLENKTTSTENFGLTFVLCYKAGNRYAHINHLFQKHVNGNNI